MSLRMKFICLVSLTLFQAVVGLRRIYGISDVHFNLKNLRKEHSLLNENTKKAPQPGIFEMFLRRLAGVLATEFSEEKLRNYCKILHKSIEKLNYKYAKQLAKHVKRLSKTHRNEISNEIIKYVNKLQNPLLNRIEFLKRMDEVFSQQHNSRFQDYIKDLYDYGNDNKLIIDTETKKIVNLIVESVKKRSMSDQNEIEQALKDAIKEYEIEENSTHH